MLTARHFLFSRFYTTIRTLSDYFSAYRKYMGDLGVQVQFCLAHLIRDVKFLTTLEGRTQKYGERLLGRLRALFELIHRREPMPPERFRRALERKRKEIVRAATHPPWTREARSMPERFRRHGDAHFRFITTPGVEPTHNLAEQAIRFLVIYRRMTQGTRGGRDANGASPSGRPSPPAASGTGPPEYLHCALHAHFSGQPAPSLFAA